MKVSATLKGVKDSIGRRTVYIRIADGARRKFHATSIRIEPVYWKKKVINHPDSKRLNDHIKSLILTYEAGDDKPDISFKQYTNQCLLEWQHGKKQGTLYQLQSKFKKFTEFFDGRLSAITPDTLTKYVSYCYSLGNQVNTVWTSLKAIRVICNKAHKEKLIPENPFTLFSMPKYVDPQKIYLSKEQVNVLDKFCQDKKCPKEYKIAAAWFVISCYTGLRYADQKAFTKSKIKDGRLIIYTSKTGKVVSIKVNPKLKELFERVNYNPVPYTNEHYNRLLKAIAAECEIKEHLTCHTARHTCAMMLANAGVSIEVTAKILSHSSIRTTAIYYSISGDRIDNEIDKIF